jgi:hypothetical protein
MNKALRFFLAATAVLGFSTAQVLARGGHGGGHHGGGHHGGGHHSHHSSHHHTGHHDHTHSHHGDHHHYHHSNWANHNRPFSHGWYGRHGGAWGYGWGGWGWGNPWAISTFGATAAWLGLNAAEPYYGNYGTVGNYLTSDETTEPETDDASEIADDSTNTDFEPEESQDGNQTDGAPAPITPEQVAAAKQMVADGKNDPPKDTTFLPLGVFSIAPEGQREASAMVQLAVSKAGQVRGTYYDLLTDHDQPIRGAVDKKTQQVAFTFGENGKVTFETSLANLTQPEGAMAAHFENGNTTSWTLARYSKEPSESEESEEAPAAEPQSETAEQ